MRGGTLPGDTSEGNGEDERSGFTVVFALVMDGAITVAKLMGFLITGSSSMLAETFHSGAEAANQGLLLWGRHRAESLEEPGHPFGYSRERYFWPLIVSVVIFVVGAVGSLWEGVHKLRHPEPVTDAGWAFAILGLALLFDGASWINAIRQARAEKTGSFWDYIKRSREPEIPMILLEDTAAVIGLVFAFGGIGLAVLSDNSAYDAIGSFAIGLLLAFVGLVLAREMKSLLIGESAHDAELAAIRRALEERPEFLDIVYLRTLYLGPGELMVETKVAVAEGVDGQDLARAIDAAEDRIREDVPVAGIIAIEPDIPQLVDPDRPAWERPRLGPLDQD